MKSYFKFSLDPQKIVPLWAFTYLFLIVPYILVLYFNNQAVQNHEKTYVGFLFIPILFVVMPIVYFYFIKFIINATSLNDESLVFSGTLGAFYGKFVLGLLFSIVTLGIFSPWFIKNLADYYTEKTSYKSRSFQFLGKGFTLWSIITLSLILVIVVFTLIATMVLHYNPNGPIIGRVIYQVVMFFAMIPYIYYIYRWSVNVKYGEYHIQWETEALASILQIAKVMLLTIVTLGLYLPMARLQMYRYFAERTVSNVVEGQQVRFGYDIEPKVDYLFLLGQGLLVIATLGIYYPWAMVKMNSRILGKTYMEKTIVA